MSIRWFVRTGTGAYVDDRSSIAQRRVDLRPETRILAPGLGIAVSNSVVASHSQTFSQVSGGKILFLICELTVLLSI